MDPSKTKTPSKIWIWVVAIILVIGSCCCAVVGGSLVYLSYQGKTLDDAFSDFQEDPDFFSGPILETVPPIETELSVPDGEAVVTEEPLGAVVVKEQILIRTDTGIWVMNEATQEARQLSNDPVDAPSDLIEGWSPDKRLYAYITGCNESPQNPALIILDTQSGNEILRIELMGALGIPDPDSYPGDPAFEAVRAIQFSGSLAWSPDGQYLAFVAARDGDSADVYLFNRSDTSITRLTAETGNASSLHWSVDGRYIEYVSVVSFGTGAGFNMLGLWVYDFQSHEARLLEALESGGEEFLGWKNENTFLIRSWSAVCEAYNLRTINADNAQQEVILDGCFSGSAYSPDTKVGLLSVTDFNQEFCSCGEALDPGLYIFSEDIPRKKFEYVIAYNIDFVQEGGLFTVFGDEGLQNIYTDDGTEVDIPVEVTKLKPYPSLQGDYWAWASYYSGKPGLWVTGNDSLPVELSSEFIGTLVWNEDGQTIYFYENNQLLMASAPYFQRDFVMDIPGTEILGLVK